MSEQVTIAEALKLRWPRIRLPQWANENAYLRLPLLKDGMHGPWAELYDEPGQIACEVPVGSQRILVITAKNDGGYVRYEGPAHPAEQENYAKGYSEA